MNKQQALKKLQSLVDSGFAFYINYDGDLALKADELLYRAYKFVDFTVKDVIYDGKFCQQGVYDDWYCASWYHSGIKSDRGTHLSDEEFEDKEYGENSKLVTFEEVEELLEVLEKEDDISLHPEISEGVKARVQNYVEDEVGIEINLSAVPFVLSPSQARVLADTIYTTLEQFTSPLSVGDTVSDNNQSLIVYGIDGDKIWCKNEESGEYFTHSREQLIKVENK